MQSSVIPERDIVFINGRRIILRPLLDEDFSDTYLSWLNDPEVNLYSQRRPFPMSADSMRQYPDYYRRNPLKGFVLAVIDKGEHRHIGNISLVNLEIIHHCADIAILIGDKRYWNQGFAGEAIYLLSHHAFFNMNLHRLAAGSINPAFVRTVEKLGWRREGEFRERVWSNGRYHNQIWLAILKNEFERRPEFEPLEGNRT